MTPITIVGGGGGGSGQTAGFTAAFAVLSFVMFGIARWSHSSVLTLNAVHCFTHCAEGLAVLATLRFRPRNPLDAAAGAAQGHAAAVLGRNDWPFGLSRLAPLIRFTVGTVLAFAGISTILESVHHLIEPHDTAPAFVELTCLAHAALAVVWQLRRGSSVAVALGAVRAPAFALLSCIAVVRLEEPRIDVASATLLAVWTVSLAVPILQDSSALLNARAPRRRAAAISDAIRSATLLRGVRRVKTQCWALDAQTDVCAAKVTVTEDGDLFEVTKQVRRTLERVFAIVVVEASRGAFDAVTTPVRAWGAVTDDAAHHHHECGHHHGHGHSHGEGAPCSTLRHAGDAVSPQPVLRFPAPPVAISFPV